VNFRRFLAIEHLSYRTPVRSSVSTGGGEDHTTRLSKGGFMFLRQGVLSVSIASILAAAGCSSGQSTPSSEANASGAEETAASLTAASPPLATKSLEDWRHEMAKTPPSKAGCFTVSHPSTTWVETACTTPPSSPVVPRKHGARAETVGGSFGDFAAQETSPITSAEGAFPLVTGVTFTTDQFSLQLNTEPASQPPFCTMNDQDPQTTCTEWQQFVYSAGGLFIQYWLIEYPKACPAGWTQFQNGTDNDCFQTGANMIGVPSPALTDLGNLTLTATAGSTNDTVVMSQGGTLYTVSQPTVFNLNDWWFDAEFNVFGPGGGAEVDLDPGSTLLVRTSVDTASPSSVVSCLDQSFTGEMNNLDALSPCCALNGLSPAIQFTESNVAGATGPACPSSTCTPKTCTFEAGMCGVQSDGCGGQIDCASCPSGQVCGDQGLCTTVCTPKTCVGDTHFVGSPTCACVPDAKICICGGTYPACHVCQ
jgi:hypothetical protein